MARDLKLKVILNAIDKATGPLRKISGSSLDTAKALKASRDRLKELQTQQRNVSSFRQLKTAQNETTKALKLGQDKVRELAGEMNRSQNPTRQMAEAFRKAKGEANKLKIKHQEQQTELHNLRTRLGEAGISTGRLGEAERKLRTEMSTTNTSLKRREDALRRIAEQQRRMARAKTQFQNTKQTAGQMAGTGARGMALGGGGLFAVSRLLAPGVSYGEQMSELQAITRLTKEDQRFQNLKQQARDLGASTAFSATEVGAGQTFLARAGFTPEAIRSSMQDILNLALANNTDLARTADIASNISSAFKINPEVEGNITRVADVLSGTAARANVNLEMLGQTMKYLGGAEDLKFSLEQAATMSGLLGNIGIQGSQAGTALRAMMNRLSAPVGKGADAIDELQIIIADANGNMRDLPDILRDINKATREMGSVQRKATLTHIFGEEAGSGMSELVSQMSGGSLDKLLEQLKNVQGENAGMAKTLADNIGGDLKGMRSAWEEIGISVTELNEGPLRNLVQRFTGVLRTTGAWINKNPELASTIATVVGGTLALVAGMGALTLMLASILGPFAVVRYGMVMFAGKGVLLLTMLKKIGMAFVWLGRLLMLNPIGLAITLMIAAAYLLWKNWADVKAGLQLIWDQMGGSFGAVLKTIALAIVNFSPIGLFYKAFAAVMGYLGVELPSKFTEFGANLISGLVSGIRNAMGSLKSTIKDVGGQAVGWFKDKLGIRSPSRVFAALGDDTMAGLKVGIDRSQRGPMAAILKAGKAMAGAGALALGLGGAAPAIAVDNRPPLASSANSMIVQGDTYHIQISAGPGTDTAQLKQMLNQLLDERSQAKAARVRSAFYDNE